MLIALTLARWAAMKAIGWSGVGRWLAAKTGGVVSSSWAWAVIAVCTVIGGLVAWRMIDPPERTYTAAEVRSQRLAGELAAKEKALAEKEAIIRDRERVLGSAVETIQTMGEENADLRTRAAKAGAAGSAAGAAAGIPGAAVVFRDDDVWLQRKRQRQGTGGAGDARRGDR